MKIPAITLWQPWASLLACGAKKYETRSWATKYRGPIAIHAAKKDSHSIMISLPSNTAKAIYGCLYEKWGIDSGALKRMSAGCIIATAELVGCYQIYDTIDNNVHIVKCLNDVYDFSKVEFIWKPEMLFGDWAEGRYAWDFANMKMLPEPIPAKGRQGLWYFEPPEGVVL